MSITRSINQSGYSIDLAEPVTCDVYIPLMVGEIAMKRIYLYQAFVLLSGLLLVGCAPGRASGQDSKPARQVVVVELFTSEGCSSCPPADSLLKELGETQPVAGAQVLALEEHVDYWNQLGWMDPFSSNQYSLRQSQYATLFKGSGVYTPQMVVDGAKEFVGGRGREARATIEEAARQIKNPVGLKEVTAARAGSTAIQIAIPASAVDGGKQGEVWLAVTESDLHSDVKVGENSGETLQHAPVVRELRKLGDVRVQDGASLQSSIKLDKKWKSENIAIVVFLTEKHTGKIFGASMLKLHGPGQAGQ